MDEKKKHQLWGSLLKYCEGKNEKVNTLSFLKNNLELIKKEGEEAAKKKKETLAQRIAALPTLNGMSESSQIWLHQNHAN